MPWIPMYADETDYQLILDKLNSDPEIAIIVSNGNGKWIARNQVELLKDGKHCLWHIPSSPLPLLAAKLFGKEDIIADPFLGWKERRPGANASIPFFGSIPSIITLQKITCGVDAPNSIGLSSFGWIGNRYRPIGIGAAKATGNWWRRMQRWIKKVAIEKIPSGESKPEIWALPSAHKRIQAGVIRDRNPPFG